MTISRTKRAASMLLAAVLTAGGLAATAVADPGSDDAVFEAEDAFLAGGTRVENEHAGYSGTGYVGGLIDANRGQASIRFDIDVAQAGLVDLDLRYANGTYSDRSLSYYVNGQKQGVTGFAPTSGWAAWDIATTQVNLVSGTNTVEWRFDHSDSGNLNLDKLIVVDSSDETVTTQAEVASISGGVQVEAEHGGFAGSGYIGGFTDQNRGNASVAFKVVSGADAATALELRYANGLSDTRTLSYYVNGVKAGTTAFAPSGGWSTWRTATTTVQLSSGENIVEWRFDASDSGNVNLDQLTYTPAGSPEPTPEPTPTPTPTPTPDPTPTPTPTETEPPGPLPFAGTLQAESATLSGGAAVENEHTGYNGSGYAGGFIDANKGTAAVKFNVAAGDRGGISLELRYANGNPDAKTLSLYVDGVKRGSTTLSPTGGWASWGTATVITEVTAGDHIVEWRFDPDNTGNVNVDQLAYSEADKPTPTPTPTATPTPTPTPTIPPVDPQPDVEGGEAEGAYLIGGAMTGSSIAGYSGAGYVEGFGAIGAEAKRTLASAAGSSTLTVTYQNTTGAARELSVIANGRNVGTISLPSGLGWQSTAVAINVTGGVNTVGLRATIAAPGVLIDRFTVASEYALSERGATLPYVQYEAEDGVTNGYIAPADRTYLTVQAEAVGRQSVRLDATGENVQFTLSKDANAINVRYSIPDSADGKGLHSKLAVYADDVKLTDLDLTSEYSWVYGGYPFFNRPNEGSAHRFFTESRVILPVTVPAGAVLKLQNDANTVAYIDIDLVEAELVPEPLTPPAGAVSIEAFGAVSGQDATAAFSAAVQEARRVNAPVWVPAGHFPVRSRINLENVSVFGAGPWYTTVAQTNEKGGFWGSGGNVTIADLRILGDSKARDDAGADAAIEGDFRSNTLIQNVWMQYTKVGVWVRAGSKDVYIVNSRIRDTWADGVNFHGSLIDNARVSQSTFRNNGDDALAMWSDGGPVTNSAFTFNTVEAPALANGAAIYGGSNNRVEDNIIKDTVNAAAGIAVSTRFGIPFSGPSYVQRNTLIRTGSKEVNWNAELGALWIYADVHNIDAPIVIRDMDILDSTYAGVLMTWEKSINGVTFDRVNVTGAGTYGIEIEATGSASFFDTVVTGAAKGGLYNGRGFVLNRHGGGNSGF